MACNSFSIHLEAFATCSNVMSSTGIIHWHKVVSRVGNETVHLPRKMPGTIGAQKYLLSKFMILWKLLR